jgi:chaperonin GroEL
MKKVKLGKEARKKLMDGVNLVADAVSATLGPNGRNIIYTENGEVLSTKDGVTVAKSISKLEDPIEDLGAQMVKQASIKTANKAGDGTTTSTLLSQFIINKGLESLDNGSNAVEVKRGIEEAVAEVKKELFSNIKQEIKSKEQILQVAAVSANNDEVIGKLVSLAMDKVGSDGVIHIEESKSGEDVLETVEGIQFDRGFKSPYMVTNNATMTCTLENAYILIVDRRINNLKELIPIMTFVSSDAEKSLLIIAEDVEGQALAGLIVNKMNGAIKVCAVKAPDFGDRRKAILEDIAILTGGEVVSQDKGHNLEKQPDENWLGFARVVTIDKEKTTIIDGKGNTDAINKRIEELKHQMDKAKDAFETEKLQERLAKFSGGIAIIHVGGNSELEIKEKKDRVDDALNAAQAAVEEGIVPGGGLALLLARKAVNLDVKAGPDFLLGKKIIYNACASPFKKILTNAGYEEEAIFKLITEIESKNKPTNIDLQNWMGYDLKSKSIVNMKDEGIIDPVKVTRCALENAASIAGTILLTEGTVFEAEKPKEQANPMIGMNEMY